ncbi:MAG TPA: nuclear transport factor 2 family protein, partial [Rhodoblastus sp.]|nr:nuclear transport factor 2 family protein [Rhodoblastus sp.]
MTPRDRSEFLPEEPDRPIHDLVREALAARDDYRRFMEFFREDASVVIVGRIYDYLFSGTYHGRDNIFALLRRIDGEIEMSDHKLHNLVVDGDKVALRRSVLVRHRGTAATRRLILANLATLREGRI